MKEPQLRSEEQGGAGKNGRRPGMKVLSTSLGVALAANLLAVPAVSAEGADAAKPQPKLVEWSTDAVKAYYDPNIDWSLVLPEQKKDDAAAQNQANAAGSTGGDTVATGGGTNTVIVNNGGGYGSSFGWDDLLLYHLLFNSGRVYSTSSWSQSHTTVYAGSHQPYQPRSYTSGTFQNKPVAGSTVRPPQTTASSGSFSTSKSTATKSTSASTSGTVSSSGSKTPSTSSSSGSFKSSGSTSSSSKSSSASSGSIGGRSSGFSSSSGS
jgi:hypothetical protein